MNFSRNNCRVSCVFSCAFSRLPCSFCRSAGSNEMDLMMQLLVISASYESCGSDGVDYSRRDGEQVSCRMELLCSHRRTTRVVVRSVRMEGGCRHGAY